MSKCKYCGKPLIRINVLNDKGALFVCGNSDCPINAAKARVENIKRRKRRSLFIKRVF